MEKASLIRIPIAILIVILLSIIGYFLSLNDFAHRKLLDMVTRNSEINYEQAQDISRIDEAIKKD